MLEILTWHEYDKLAGECQFIAVTRPGFVLEKLDGKLRKCGLSEPVCSYLPIPGARNLLDRSCGRRVREGRSIKYLTPGACRGLYQAAGALPFFAALPNNESSTTRDYAGKKSKINSPSPGVSSKRCSAVSAALYSITDTNALLRQALDVASMEVVGCRCRLYFTLPCARQQHAYLPPCSRPRRSLLYSAPAWICRSAKGIAGDRFSGLGGGASHA